jgi:hypothetical protein
MCKITARLAVATAQIRSRHGYWQSFATGAPSTATLVDNPNYAAENTIRSFAPLSVAEDYDLSTISAILDARAWPANCHGAHLLTLNLFQKRVDSEVAHVGASFHRAD